MFAAPTSSSSTRSTRSSRSSAAAPAPATDSTPARSNSSASVRTVKRPPRTPFNSSKRVTVVSSTCSFRSSSACSFSSASSLGARRTHQRATRPPSVNSARSSHLQNTSSSTSWSPSAAASPPPQSGPAPGSDPKRRTSSSVARSSSQVRASGRNSPLLVVARCAMISSRESKSKRRGSYHLCIGPSAPSLTRQRPNATSAWRMLDTRPQRSSRPSITRPWPRFLRSISVYTPFRNFGCQGMRTRGSRC